MKIAFFHELTPLSGARKVIEEYGKILGKEHKIDLYYVDDGEDKSVLKIFNNVYFFKFDEKHWRGNNWKAKLYKDSIELIRLYFLHKKISKIIKENRYDLVLINPSKFTQAPFLLRFIGEAIYFCEEPLRIVYDELFSIPKGLGFSKIIYEKINRIIRKTIDRGNMKSARVVLANSNFSRDNIGKAYGIKAYVCYLGVDVRKFQPLGIKKAQDILFVGEKTAIEGHDLLEQTLKLYKEKPSVAYVIRNEMGEGISEEKLIRVINRSKIILALSKNEPFGLIPIESMACEVPVIAVNEGGFKESVANGKTGFLIDRKQEKLKDKIDLLLSNDKLRIEMGMAGRKLVLDKFSWEKSAIRFLDIVKTVV